MLSRRTFVSTSFAAVLCGQEKKPDMFADAEAYQQFMGRWSRLVAPQLVDFADVPDGGTLLDVGSGTGSLAFTLAERKPRAHVRGVDPSKEYVEYARSKNSFPDRVAFETGDAQALHLADATFDASLSLLVFNFIPDRLKALKEVRRVTKPGGRVSASVWDYGDGMKMLRVFWDSVVSIDSNAEKLDEKHMPLCREGELSTLWRQGGLEDVRAQPHVITMQFKSFADFWDPFLLGQGPAGAYVRSLGRDRAQALRAEVKKRVSPSNESAAIDLSARVWSVRGTVPKR
jgi:SAM-dependent methyltransferase